MASHNCRELLVEPDRPCPIPRDGLGLPTYLGSPVIRVTDFCPTIPAAPANNLSANCRGLWSGRRGDFCVVYEIDDAANIVIVLRVQHRSDVYRSRSPAAVSTLTGVRGSNTVSSWALIHQVLCATGTRRSVSSR